MSAGVVELIMRMRLCIVALALLLGACTPPLGQPGPKATFPTAPPSVVGISPGSGGPILSTPQAAGELSDADNGKTVTLRVGRVVNVVLHQPNGYGRWQGPTTSNPGILQGVPNGAAASVVGVTLASFKGVSQGTAILNASADLQCGNGASCSGPPATWSVTVRVTG